MSKLAQLTLVVCLLSVACSDLSRSDIELLLARRATRAEVEDTLGKGRWYAPTDPGLAEALAREPSEAYRPVHDAMGQQRGILYYTTVWQMTWLFFDENDRLVGYWLNSQ